jgi:ribose 1,5-bisphosphokinase
MGPSGAGKDALLRFARDALADGDLVFAHRYITRAPIAGDENFIQLSPEEFASRQRHGLFRFAWEARGTSYAIGYEIELWRASGCPVVVSGSRAHFAAEASTIAGLWPVLITAPPEVIARRLALREREAPAEIAERLARGKGEPPRHPRLLTIENAGPLDEAGRILLSFLRTFQRADAPARSGAPPEPARERG